MNRSHHLKLVQSGVWVALAFFAPLAAKADFVNNGIFAPTPTGDFTTLNGGDTSITGWTVTGASVDWMGATYWQAPPLGGTSIDVDGSGAGGMQQTVAGLTAGKTYTLSFEFAGNPGDNRFGATKTMNVSVGSALVSFSFDTTGHSNSSMGWTPESFTFTAGSTNTLLFASTDNAGSDAGPVIGDVSINAVTPEPAFYGALAIGLSGLVYAVRRRRVAEK